MSILVTLGMGCASCPTGSCTGLLCLPFVSLPLVARVVESQWAADLPREADVLLCQPSRLARKYVPEYCGSPYSSSTANRIDPNVSSSAEGDEGEKQTIFFILLILILLPMMQEGIT